jgi:hypothetical protein
MIGVLSGKTIFKMDFGNAREDVNVAPDFFTTPVVSNEKYIY